MEYRISVSEGQPRPLHINAVEAGRPLAWLRAGWHDFRRAPGIGLAYGIVVAVAGYALVLGLSRYDQFYLVPALTAGFLLVAPVLALGLYQVARRLERGERPRLGDSLSGWWRNHTNVANLGLLLMVIFLAWLMLSRLAFAIAFSTMLATWEDFLPLSRLLLEDAAFFAVWVGMGAVIAALVFRATAVAVPLLLDRDLDLFNALFASWAAVGHNARAMVLWAGLVVLVTGIGILTAFIGLAVAFPVLAFATWHAYRDIITPGD